MDQVIKGEGKDRIRVNELRLGSPYRKRSVKVRVTKPISVMSNGNGYRKDEHRNRTTKRAS